MENDRISLVIKGAPLIKFQSKERIMRLQQGHLYAKTLSYYRELEKESGDADIGDEFEAMLHVNQGSLINKSSGEVTALSDALIRTTNSDDFVFCMLGIYPNLDSFEFSEKQKEKMLSFGDTALIILDSQAFINRVSQAANKVGVESHFKAVQYYNPNYDLVNIWVSLMNGMWNMAFWKRESYRYQQEGRFVFIPKEHGADHIKIDIGDISDISKIVPATSAITAIVNRIG